MFIARRLHIISNQSKGYFRFILVLLFDKPASAYTKSIKQNGCRVFHKLLQCLSDFFSWWLKKLNMHPVTRELFSAWGTLTDIYQCPSR